jgi:arylsulfatase A-like enzyme
LKTRTRTATAISVGALMRPLAEDKTTIAEMLRDRGYTTVALMTNVHLKSAFGMTQGFDRVEEFNAACYRLSVYRVLRVMGLIERPDLAVEGRPRATEITDHALGWLGKLESRPFFLYVHYMDTHHPYRPPEEFADMFGGISRNPRELFMETTRFLDPDTTVTIDEQELSRLRDYYDACIRYNDYEIGRILDRIREISNDRETVVVITADHGDEFMEHGTLYHNNLLIQELIHIPLIVWAPGQVPGGQRISPLVRHIDVMPTIAQMTDAVLPDEAMGESLLPLMTGAEMDRNVSSFAEGNYCTSLIYDGWKAVYVDSTNRTHLYNLVEDPGATRDLAALEPERLQSMQEQLFEYRDRAATLRKEMEAASDEEVVDQLRKLGYIN